MADAWGTFAPALPPWVDQGTERAAVEAAAAVAAERTRRGVLGQEVPDMFGSLAPRTRGQRAEGAITRGLYGLGHIPMGILGAAGGLMQSNLDSLAEQFPAQSGITSISTDDDPRRRAGGLGAETAMNLMGLPSLTGNIVPGSAGIFGGRLAKTADTAKLAQAEDMAAKGAGPSDIWDATGWFRGADKKWRFEIPDNEAAFNPEKMLPKEYKIFGNSVMGREGVAGDVMSHPGFFAAYPDAAGMAVGQTRYGGGNRGTYHPPGLGDEMVGLDAPLLEGPARDMIPDGARGVMLHELQHRTQQAEGFARGGDPKTIGSIPNPDFWRYRDALRNDKELQRYGELRDSPKYKAEIEDQNRIWLAEYQPRLEKIYARGKGYTPGDADQVFADFNAFKAGKYPLDEEADRIHKSLRKREVPMREPEPMLSGGNLYSRLAGEVEARNVQARMNMTPAERRAQPPWATEDTSAPRQVVFDRDGPVVGPAASGETQPFGSMAPGGLPMDEASRMARAKELGFDTSRVTYHGSPDARGIDDGFKTLRERHGVADPGRAFFFTDNPRVAKSYADPHRAWDYQGSEPAVVPAYLKMQNPKEIDWGGKRWRGTEKMIEEAKAAGHDGVVIKNVIDDYQGDGKPTTVRVVFNPEQVRKPQAAFDPANKDSGFLLGANSTDKKTGAAIVAGQHAGDTGPVAPFGSLAPPKSMDELKARTKAIDDAAQVIAERATAGNGFRSSDGTLLLSRNIGSAGASGNSPWRITRFDGKEPVGHYEGNARELARDIVHHENRLLRAKGQTLGANATDRKTGAAILAADQQPFGSMAPGVPAELAKHVEGLRKYYGERKFSTEQEGRETIRRNLERDNEKYKGLFGPTDLSVVDHLSFVKSGNSVKLSQRGMTTRRPVEILDEPTGNAPRVDWSAPDLVHDGTAQSAFKKYGRGVGSAREGYISIDDLPKEKLAGGKDQYDWSELQSRRSAPPPVTIRINKNGTTTIMDGNHRINYWREQGHDQVPAFIIDERPKGQ